MSHTPIAAATAEFGALEQAPKSIALVRRWLYCVALLIALIVVVGGATRLTESGLSITEWKPIHGVIPPLSVGEWQEEFAKYQQIPEFQQLRPNMTLGEFKGIFWWEWSHRILARLVGFVVLLPALFFWMTGHLRRDLVPKVVIMLVLGGAQGALGWFMVASGLSVRTDVSQYRLAAHLTLACIILCYILWVARGLSPASSFFQSAKARTSAAIVAVMTLVQVFLGGLVAGLKAGHTYNSWPLMDGRLIPEGLGLQSPWWTNFFENVTTVQFDHRVGAYVLLALALGHALRSGLATAWGLFGLVVAQACLGIATLVLFTGDGSVHLQLTHQFGAIVVLSAAMLHWRSLTPPAGMLLPAI